MAVKASYKAKTGGWKIIVHFTWQAWDDHAPKLKEYVLYPSCPAPTVRGTPKNNEALWHMTSEVARGDYTTPATAYVLTDWSEVSKWLGWIAYQTYATDIKVVRVEPAYAEAGVQRG